MNEDRMFRLDEISLRSILGDILKNLWVIIAAAAAVWLALSGLHKLIYVPEYTAKMTLAANTTTGSGSYASLATTSRMAGIFCKVFAGNVLENSICQDLGIDHMNGYISADVMGETNLFIVSATSENPKLSYQILISALENYETVSDTLFSNAVINIVREPDVPHSPDDTGGFNRTRQTAVLCAAVAMLCLIMGWSAFRFTVKTREGALRNLDGKILGMIRYEKKILTWKEFFKKKKKAILISYASVSVAFAESVRKTAARIEHHMRRRYKILLVASISENEGKSSVAANLALALAEKGKKVILIDCDLKKPSQYRIFDRPAKAKGWLADYLKGQCQANDILSYHRRDHFFSVFQNTGVENSVSLLTSDRMKTLIAACEKMADYIIMDSPPMAVCSDTENLLSMADTAVLVVRQDWSDTRAINDAAELIRHSGTDFAGFVLNAFKQDISLRQTGVQEYGDYHKYYRQEGSETDA